MPADELLRRVFVSLEVNEDCTAATLVATDGSCLQFRHSVGERWVRATSVEAAAASEAQQVLSSLARFRLNRKHLDLFFSDGSRWEAQLQ